MKIILSSRRHRYVAIVSIVLVTVALIAGMVGCAGGPYDLTISSNEGGTVTTPGEGTFTYDAGTVVDLVATPDAGYRFAGWWTIGYVETIADRSGATTTITMNDDYSISAHFALEIRDWYDLDAVRYDLDAIINQLRGSYLLVNDLDSTTPGYEEMASPTANDGKGWQPIGNYSTQFAGRFYGEGYEIRDLFINRPDETRVGLFGSFSAAYIRDVGVVNAKVTGRHSVGALVGHNGGNVYDSYSTGNVTGEGSVGGLVGSNDGVVYYSCSTGSVTGNSTVGGLAGSNSNDVHYSYSTGNVTGEGSVGGLVGMNMEALKTCTVGNSYSTGSVTGNQSVGGLVGFNWGGTVSNSYSTGSVTGNEYAGGLVGWDLGGTVSSSFWDTETSGKSTSGGGTGKTTAEMQDIATFSGATWDIVAVANPSTRDPAYIWNIVDDVTYPFLSWQP